MIRSCLFLSICVLVLVDAAADWRLVKSKESERPAHQHRSDHPHPDSLSPVRPSHHTKYRLKTIPKEVETDEFRRQNKARLTEDDQIVFALIIGCSVGGAVVIILAIVLVALFLRNRRRRQRKIIEKESKPITNPRYQISIINPKLRGPPPAYDIVNSKKGNSNKLPFIADGYDVKMDDVKGIKFHHSVGSNLNLKSSKDPKFEDLYNHLNATDVQNVHQNLYKRGDSTDSSTGGDDADNELSDEVEVKGPSKERKDNAVGLNDKAETGKF